MTKMKHRKWILILSFLLTFPFLFQSQLSYAARIDPSFRFSTIETEHFVIHFHQGLDDTARRAASLSEGLHVRLSPVFQWKPAEKTRIVLMDNMDFANGMATVLPYNAMYIFVVPPFPDMTIGEYDDWLELVLLHEYVHILTMDPASGYSGIMRKIFGKPLPGYDPLSFLLFLTAAPPNVFLPDWWTEGISTWAETEFSDSGRGRSSYVEMIFRMSVLEDTLPSVDQLNGDLPYWPSGNIPYIYGMLLQQYIAGTKGKETPGALSIAHSGRLPFLITAPAERLTGFNYTELYRSMVSELKSGQMEKISRLKTKPLTNYNRIPVRGERVTNPRLSPDGRYLAVNRRDPHFHEEIVVLDAVTFEEVATVRRFPSDHSLAWSYDSRRIYFTQAEVRNSYNFYQDIFSYSLDERSTRSMTRDIRAKDVDASSDGKRLAFVKVATERQNIALLDIESGRVELVTDLKGEALSSPRWSPDGKYIVFSKRIDSGQTSVELLDIESRKTESLIVAGYDNLYPVWSPDGRYIIYSSDRTGVYNLFAYSLEDRDIYQVSHVLGGAFQPEAAGDGGRLLYTGYGAKGFYIAEMPLDPSQWSSTLSPRIEPSWKSPDNEQETSDVPVETDDVPPPLITEKEEYCPLKTVLPRFWLPSLTFDHDGAVFGAFTAGQDVLGYHSYILEGGVGVSGRGYYNVSYIYDRWQPTLFLNAHSRPVLYSEFFDDEESYYEKRDGLRAGVIVPIIRMSNLETQYNIIAGYSYVRLKHLTDIDGRTVDGLEVYEGRRDNMFAGFLYSGALRYPYSISREEGRNLSLMYRKYTEGFDQKEYSLGYEEFIRVRPGKNDVVYVSIDGAASYGEQVAQQAYHIGGIPSYFNTYSIRGFSSGFETGKYVLTGTLEYRFPLKYILRGWNTKPIFFDRLHLAAFADGGNVWGNSQGFRMGDFSVGMGIEARIDIVLGYKLKITPAIGIAQGLTDDGKTQPYINVYTEL